MTVSVGDKVPDVEVHVLGADGRPQSVRTGDVLGSGRVVLFAVPGAFTPGCSKVHLPGYVQRADELHASGVDKIVCVAVNDAWVIDQWATSQGVGDKIVMLADGSGSFAKAMGLQFDGSAVGLGVRSQRYSALIEDGTITQLNVESSPGVDVSSCETMLKQL